MISSKQIPIRAADELADAISDLIGERLSVEEAREVIRRTLNEWEAVEIDTNKSQFIQTIILPLIGGIGS